MGDRSKRRLGDACGLTRFGVNLVTLGPGGQSALRHWHTLEDEFVYVLSGEVVLVTNDGEQVLGPGACAGYPAARTMRTISSTAAARRRPISKSAIAPRATTRSTLTTTSCGSRTRTASHAAHKDGGVLGRLAACCARLPLHSAPPDRILPAAALAPRSGGGHCHGRISRSQLPAPPPGEPPISAGLLAYALFGTAAVVAAASSGFSVIAPFLGLVGIAGLIVAT
jgi:hypothetical protein